ncbi:MAG: prepilin peptidase [Vicinamibacterales bacterium]
MPPESAFALPAFTLTVAGLFGLIVGSFLNVCIYRLPRHESVVFPASRCPSCGAAIRAWHNIPVLSYLVLGGRCASCRAPIGVQYPIVEATTGALFVLHAWVLGPQALLFPRLLFCAALIVLFVVDLEHRRLPNVITLPGIPIGLAFSLVLPPGWWSALIGVVVGAGILWLVAEAYYRFRHEEGLGMGDVKMLAMIGAFLGWKLVLLTLVLSSFSGALMGLALIVMGRGTLKYELPYGTFLALAAGFASLFGAPLVDWYAAFYQ